MLVEGSKLLNAIARETRLSEIVVRILFFYPLHSRLQSTHRESMRVAEKSLRSITFVDVEPSCTLLIIFHRERVWRGGVSGQLMMTDFRPRFLLLLARTAN